MIRSIFLALFLLLFAAPVQADWGTDTWSIAGVKTDQLSSINADGADTALSPPIECNSPPAGCVLTMRGTGIYTLYINGGGHKDTAANFIATSTILNAGGQVLDLRAGRNYRINADTPGTAVFTISGS